MRPPLVVSTGLSGSQTVLLVRVMNTRLVPNSSSFSNRPLSKIGVGLTTNAGKRAAGLLVVGMPVLLIELKVWPLSLETSGVSAWVLAYCQTRNSVVGVLGGEPGMALDTRTAPAVMMSRFLPPTVGP